MTAPTTAPQRRALLIKLALLALVAAGVGLLALKGVNFKELITRVLDGIREVGPTAFFLGMALLPAIGFPLLAFTLTVGPAFSAQLGTGTVVLLTFASIAVNLALTYWLARFAFRPLLEGIIRKLGYQLPQVAAEDHRSLTLLVRVTPGPPFFVQSYLLGLAGVRFSTYMAISTGIAGSYAVALVFFGQSLASGKGQLALLAFSLVAALSVLVQWIRRRMMRKRAAGA